MIVVSTWPDFECYFDQVSRLERICDEIATWDLTTWKGLFERLSMRAILFFDDELLKGLIVVSNVQDEAELLKICVDPVGRRKGVGTILIRQAVGQLKRLGVTLFHLEARKDNHSAIALYQSLGFVQTGERKNYYSNPVCDAVLYRCQI